MNLTKCYKYRLEPNHEQERQFLQFAGCRRFVWNWALGRKQEYYKATGKTINYNTLASELVKLKKQPDTEFLKECHSQVLQQTMMDLDKAFKSFFEKRAKFPKFKKKKTYRPAFRIAQCVSIKDGKVSVPKIGLVKVRLHRPLEGEVKSATIKQEPDGKWYVVFVSHIEVSDVPLTANNPVGIDVGLTSFITLDTGEKVDPPKFYRKSQNKLKRLQRHLSRCQQGSKGRQKAKLKIAKFHAKTANHRNDFLHKLSTTLVEKYDTICVEDLNIKALAKTKLSKSFNDAALGTFLRQLDYKCQWQFKQLQEVDRWFPSSKLCHVCLHKQHLELSDRKWLCGDAPLGKPRGF